MRPETNKRLGLLAMCGIWLTAGFALPFVNVLQAYAPEQLMVARGLLTALITFVILGGKVWSGGRYTYLIAVILPFATLGLYQGVRHWGAGPTIVVVTATPVVTFAISLILGRSIRLTAVIGLTMLLLGVFLAHWQGTFHWEGFLWSAFGTVLNGFLYELFARAAEETSAFVKCFWGCVGTVLLGLVLGIGHSWFRLSDYAQSWASILDMRSLGMLFVFAFVHGFVYWISNVKAFEHLETNEASILAQVEAVVVIIGAWLFLGEHFSTIQWAGVLLAVIGSAYLITQLADDAPESQEA